jgi:hypothetical protein
MPQTVPSERRATVRSWSIRSIDQGVRGEESEIPFREGVGFRAPERGEDIEHSLSLNQKRKPRREFALFATTEQSATGRDSLMISIVGCGKEDSTMREWDLQVNPQ